LPGENSKGNGIERVVEGKSFTVKGCVDTRLPADFGWKEAGTLLSPRRLDWYQSVLLLYKAN
jgi:hypothetical protein